MPTVAWHVALLAVGVVGFLVTVARIVACSAGSTLILADVAGYHAQNASVWRWCSASNLDVLFMTARVDGCGASLASIRGVANSYAALKR